MDPDPELLTSLIILKSAELDFYIYLATVLFLLIMSALVSGSEVSFFSLKPVEIQALKSSNDKRDTRLLALLERPNELLATILISNNFINIAIVVCCGLWMEKYLIVESELVAFMIKVVLITFLILLFGEIIPKVYANQKALNMSLLMGGFFHVLVKYLRPFSKILVNSTRYLRKSVKKREQQVSVDELEHAIDLAYPNGIDTDEQKILKGIVEFGSKEVEQVMTPRVELVAVNNDMPNKELIETIRESGFSRLPVYEENLDELKGILYVKDLLSVKDKDNFDWQTLVRPAYFVPENKMISDLLREFQQRKIHLAVVVDEYGGVSGVISLEDIIEEIVGEIFDEFDDEDVVYSKLDNFTYVFEARTLLVDFYKVLNVDSDFFEQKKGQATTLGGFIIENAGKIPRKGEKISFKKLDLEVDASDMRRVKRVKVILKK